MPQWDRSQAGHTAAMRSRMSAILWKVTLPTTLLLSACGSSSSPGTLSAQPLASMPNPPASTPTASVALPAGSVVQTEPPEATATASAGTPAVTVDALAIVTVDGLNIREAPTQEAPVQTIAPGAPTSGQPIQLSADEQVWVIDVERAGDEAWYHIVQDGSFNTGWISGGPPEDPWLMPFDRGACPASFSEALAPGDPVPPFAMEHLVCFGGAQLIAVVYWLPPDAQNLPCSWPDGPAAWLICYEAVNVTGDTLPQLTVYGTVGRDDIARGAWVTIRGHYDDPRSSTCPETLGRDLADAASVAATIISCRSAFVLDEVQRAVAP